MSDTNALRVSDLRAAAKADVQPLWQYEDVATYLGMSTKWVQTQTRAGRIPHSRHGRMVRFDPQEIQHWNASKTVRAS